MQELVHREAVGEPIAGCSTSASDFVPYLASAIDAESTAAGSVRAERAVARDAVLAGEHRGVAAFGAGPWPLMTITCAGRARNR